ncbi:porin [Burkholderia sp. L27(2015)]|uniref:porin n=1 Tax=Burkholderia sp. L27(2015) TaxID=1641858 RepID=UPI00131C5460|nr:porin [Burkholderia sp. L27(2015)]
MREILFAGAIVALASTGVQAQSSATIYGSLDTGIDYVTNSSGKHLVQESSGKRTPDRFGFRIVEDLGDGDSVFVRLENGFVTNTGAQINPTAFFNRYALVGISDTSYGAIMAGNMPGFMYENVGGINNSVPGISSFYTVGNLDDLANTRALNNSIKYLTPDIHGFKFGVMNSFGGTAGDFSAGRQYSFGAEYVQNSVKAGLAYTMSHNRTADVFGVFGLSSLLGQPLAAGTLFNASRYSELGGGLSVALGIFTPHLTVTDVKLADTQGSESERNYQVGVNIDLSGGNRFYILGISYNRSNFTDLAYNQYNLFLTHYLSATTQIYAGVGLQRASGPNAHAEQFGYQPSSSNSQTVARIGVNKMF